MYRISINNIKEYIQISEKIFKQENKSQEYEK